MPHTPVIVTGVLAFAASAGGSVIDQTSHVPIGASLTIAVFAGTIVWYLARELQGIKDGIARASDDTSKLSTRFDKIESRLESLTNNCIAHRERVKMKEEGK